MRNFTFVWRAGGAGSEDETPDELQTRSVDVIWPQPYPNLIPYPYLKKFLRAFILESGVKEIKAQARNLSEAAAPDVSYLQEA